MQHETKLHELYEKLLSARSLDVVLDERKETPLIWAVSEGYHDIALTLIEAGARLDAQNTDGNTALLRASCEGRVGLALALIANGADLDVQNNDGYSAIILAKRRGNHEIATALLSAGADTRLVTKQGLTVDNPGHSPRTPLAGPRDPALEQLILEAISRFRPKTTGATALAKEVCLDAELRFVDTNVLRNAYVRYDASLNATAPPFVELENGLELGIVSSAVPEIARAVSSLLCRSLEDSRNDLGGHLPTDVVRRVQREIISPFGVACIWGVTGHRFVLSRATSPGVHEILATILVGRSKDTIFFFTGRYNNLRHSTLAETVDFEQPDSNDPNHKWFDRFAFPDIRRFKPKNYHHIANFVVAKEHRNAHISRLMLDSVREYYSRDWQQAKNLPIRHSQYLLCGRGFWQIGDPPWLARMQRLGFFLRRGAESFFIEHPWAPLPTIFDPQTQKTISNVEYNSSFGLPKRYQNDPAQQQDHNEHLTDRIGEVIRLAQDPRAKLQYFQAMFDFV